MKPPCCPHRKHANSWPRCDSRRRPCLEVAVARQCVYCSRPGALSRDHVWPECFLERFGVTVAKFSVKARRVHGADYVVRDVCPTCNSGPLSVLDTYFCAMYDDYFHILSDLGSTVVLHYDFDLLARALLRIAFNSARGAGSET